jgi:hypothetical protein
MTENPKRSVSGFDPLLCTERQGRSLFVQLQSEMMKPENEELRSLATEMAKRSCLQRSEPGKSESLVARLTDPAAFSSEYRASSVAGLDRRAISWRH